MSQSPLTMALHRLSRTGVLSVGFLLIGCATFTAPTGGTFDNHDSVAGPALEDPFRGPSRPIRRSERSIGRTVPFLWKTVATTESGEPLQANFAGRTGFRSLVIGSVAGNDTVAVNFTEKLARYLHSNELIMGGVRATVLRSLNPDGIIQNSHRNAGGLYLNALFPHGGVVPSPAETNKLPKEIRFLIGYVLDQRPQRIIHIRTVRGSRGLLAVSHGATDSGREVREWLDFDLRSLPRDVNQGTLESWASHRGDTDVITFGIPSQTDEDDAWALYGDAVLTLLQDGDSKSRRVAREQKQQRTTNHRHPWGDQSNNTSWDEMFQEDLRYDFRAAAGFDTLMFE